jgi:hypothetical protein
MGIELCDSGFRLPDYVRLQISSTVNPRQPQTQPRPLSHQVLAQLILQIVSHDQFAWYVIDKKRENIF